MSTLQELENKLALLHAATYPAGHRFAGQRVSDVDKKYSREVFALGVQVEEMRGAEAKRVEISPDQNQQLAWLDRMATARDKDGRQLYFDHGQQGSALRNSIGHARMKLANGTSLSQAEAESIRQVAQSAGAHSYPETPVTRGGTPMLPPATFNPQAHLGSQPINTTILPSK